MDKITHIAARMILDSRGIPTVEAEIVLHNGVLGRAAIPSGASTGQFEALELRDQDPSRWMGKGVDHALENIRNHIAPALINKTFDTQKALDDALLALDPCPRKSTLGANSLLPLSLAFARAQAQFYGKPLFASLHDFYQQTWRPENLKLPVPLMNVINGGVHADNTLTFQEVMIVPFGFASFSEALRAGVEIYHTLKALLKSKGKNVNVGDEGGFAPDLHLRGTLDFLMEAIVQAGYTPGKQIALALDVAASEFYHDRCYHIPEEKLVLTSEQLIAYYNTWVSEYPILSIEDGMADDDTIGWKSLTAALGSQIQLVGDDLFVTHPQRLAQGIADKLANSILVKVNQIGTLTEACTTIALAKEHNYTTIISHRSGETGDNFIADLAVATGAGQIKTGAPARSDRLSKYNQLLRIEEVLGQQAVFAGQAGFSVSHFQRF